MVPNSPTFLSSLIFFSFLKHLKTDYNLGNILYDEKNIDKFHLNVNFFLRNENGNSNSFFYPTGSTISAILGTIAISGDQHQLRVAVVASQKYFPRVISKS